MTSIEDSSPHCVPLFTRPPNTHISQDQIKRTDLKPPYRTLDTAAPVAPLTYYHGLPWTTHLDSHLWTTSSPQTGPGHCGIRRSLNVTIASQAGCPD
ncbi:uncharacterized protein LAESUDRAFT_724417 [Laetiporus sulphureus 93-53]|uniref:Uncharacterized protein n=1 Tax=Laetiporus sulphureus 93-53 TaxID=1314785 RepID=A0A165EXR2_9APHY|nr:uncharacterized protein LAESUDRAFT_724417 [Laetiporus sulphureus 93-53]KZT07937.1 hypothetical protein LAESUDRAFT_724417 [Laetiporus sulphureus 93-53]